MRLLSVLPFSPPSEVIGGAEKQMHSLHRGLLASGVDVQVLADIAAVGAEHQVFQGLNIWGVPFPVLTAHPLRPGNIAVARTLLRISRFVRARLGDFDVVQACTYRQPGLIGAMLATQLGVPLVVRLACSGTHGDIGFARSNWMLRWTLPAVIRRTDAVVALERETAREASAAGVPPERIHVIGNAVAIRAVTDQVAESNGTSPHVLYVGRVTAQKRLDSLISGFAGILADRPVLRLAVVGGGDVDSLRGVARDQGIEHAADFAGFDANPEKYFLHALCFVNPSESEGLPNAVLEACAYGVPVVLSDIPIHRQIAESVGMGDFLFPVGDGVMLSRSLRAFMDLEESRKVEIRARCRDFGRRFTTTERDKSYLNLYRDLAPERSR